MQTPVPNPNTKPEMPDSRPTDQNTQRFLDFLGKAEGADYDVIVGGKRFADYSRHPGVVGLRTKEGPSTAAGKYQITKTTYDEYAPKLGIKDFSPQSQDRIALELIRSKGALEDVQKGDFLTAINKLGSTWASLPSSPYTQPKRDWNFVEANLGVTPGKRAQQTQVAARTQKATKGASPTAKKPMQVAGLDALPESYRTALALNFLADSDPEDEVMSKAIEVLRTTQEESDVRAPAGGTALQKFIKGQEGVDPFQFLQREEEAEPRLRGSRMRRMAQGGEVQNFAVGGLASGSNLLLRASMVAGKPRLSQADKALLGSREAQINAYNQALQRYEQEVADYNREVEEYERRVDDYNRATSSIEASFSKGAGREIYIDRNTGRQVELPSAPSFNRSAPQAPSLGSSQEQYDREVAAAQQSAQKRAAGRALAIDVALDPGKYNLAGFGGAGAFAQGGEVHRQAGSPPQGERANEIPQVGPDGRLLLPTPEPEPELSLAEKARGLIETGATIATGAVAAPIAAVTGLARGKNINEANVEAGKVMEAMTYQPRSEAGRRYLEQFGKAMQESKLDALLPQAQLLNVRVAPGAARYLGEQAKGKVEEAVMPTLRKQAGREDLTPEEVYGAMLGKPSEVMAEAGASYATRPLGLKAEVGSDVRAASKATETYAREAALEADDYVRNLGREVFRTNEDLLKVNQKLENLLTSSPNPELSDEYKGLIRRTEELEGQKSMLEGRLAREKDRAQVFTNFAPTIQAISDKAADYFTNTFGTVKDPLYKAFVDGRWTPNWMNEMEYGGISGDMQLNYERFLVSGLKDLPSWQEPVTGAPGRPAVPAYGLTLDDVRAMARGEKGTPLQQEQAKISLSQMYDAISDQTGEIISPYTDVGFFMNPEAKKLAVPVVQDAGEMAARGLKRISGEKEEIYLWGERPELSDEKILDAFENHYLKTLRYYYDNQADPAAGKVATTSDPKTVAMTKMLYELVGTPEMKKKSLNEIENDLRSSFGGKDRWRIDADKRTPEEVVMAEAMEAAHSSMSDVYETFYNQVTEQQGAPTSSLSFRRGKTYGSTLQPDITDPFSKSGKVLESGASRLNILNALIRDTPAFDEAIRKGQPVYSLDSNVLFDQQFSPFNMEDIAEYAATLSPRDLQKASFADLVVGSEGNWTNINNPKTILNRMEKGRSVTPEQALLGVTKTEYATPLVNPVLGKNRDVAGWYEITSPDGMKAEGLMAQHCIKQPGYYNQYMNGESKFFTLRDSQGYPKLTIQMRNKDYRSLTDPVISSELPGENFSIIAQIKGNYNSPDAMAFQDEVNNFFRNYMRQYNLQKLQITEDPDFLTPALRGEEPL